MPEEKTYAAYVEDATGIVLQTVPGYGPIDKPPDAEQSIYVLTEAEFYAHQAWVQLKEQNKNYIRNSDGTFSVADFPVLPAVIDKTAMLADGVDLVTISGLPNPTTILIEGLLDSYKVEDGTFEFTYDTPKVFTVTCKAAGYLDLIFTITAT